MFLRPNIYGELCDLQPKSGRSASDTSQHLYLSVYWFTGMKTYEISRSLLTGVIKYVRIQMNGLFACSPVRENKTCEISRSGW